MAERRNSMATNVMKNMSYKSVDNVNLSISISFINVSFSR